MPMLAAAIDKKSACKNPRSESGFVMIFGLLLLPLLLTLLSVAGAGAISALRYSKGQMICRTGTLRIEDSMAASLNNLIALNPTAQALRIQRTIADETVLAAMSFPPALPAAKAQQTAVITQQRALHFRQKMIIKLADLNSQRLIQTLRARLYSEGYNATVPTRLELPVTETPSGSDSPDHLPKDPLESRAAIRIQWTRQLLNDFPAGLKNWIPLSKSMEGKCSATITKTGMAHWSSRLGEGKSLSKY